MQVLQYPNMHSPGQPANVTWGGASFKLARNFTAISEWNEQLAKQCGKQLAKINGRGQNVSVLGLAILLFFTVLLFLVSNVLWFWAGRKPPGGMKRERCQREQLLELWREAKGDSLIS